MMELFRLIRLLAGEESEKAESLKIACSARSDMMRAKNHRTRFITGFRKSRVHQRHRQGDTLRI